MNPTLIQALQLAIAAQLSSFITKDKTRFQGPPVVLIGTSGIGKTAAIGALARGLGKNFIGFETAGKRAEDLVGYPYPDLEKGWMDFLPSRQVVEALKAGEGKTIMFFDEICDVSRSTQKACHSVFCGHKFGDIQGPIHMALVGAGNPPDISTTGGSLSLAMKMRVCQLEAKCDPITFAQGLRNGFPSADIISIPNNWTELIPAKNSLVASFIEARPELAETQADQDHLPSASPRQWTHVAVYNAICEASGMLGCRSILLEGCVGHGPAFEYIKWEKDMDLPAPLDILSGNFAWPSRGDQILAMSKSLVAYVISKDNPDVYQKGWEFLGDMVRNGYSDMGALSAGDMAANMPKGWQGKLPKECDEFGPILKEAGLI